MPYKKKLGLDLGTKSMGIAISDGLNMLAHPKENFFYKNNDLNLCVDKVKEYINLENVDTIILGYPLYPSGDKSPTTLLIEEFQALLEQSINIPIILIDEAYSTKIAQTHMLQGNISRKKRKTKKDMLAAQIILQHYLDKQ